MSRHSFLMFGGFLMVLLGLARGAGGIVLLTQSAAADANIKASETTIFAAGLILMLLGAALVVTAVGVFRRRRPLWRTGIVCTSAFVIDGAVNGYVLYGRPGDRGTAVNVIAAALIVACLLLGRGALRGSRAGTSAAGVSRGREW